MSECICSPWDNYWCINYSIIRVVITIHWDMGTMFPIFDTTQYITLQGSVTQTTAHGPNPAHCLILYSSELRIVFTLINGGKIKRIIISCDMWRWYDIQISVFTNKIPLEHSHSQCLHIVCACFCAAKRSWIVAAVTRWPAKLKILTSWPFRESLPPLP